MCAIFRKESTLPFGIARYDDTLPLLPCRGAARIPERAAAVILVLFPYYLELDGKRNLSRYAMIADYHTVAGGHLQGMCVALQRDFPGNQFVHFVDNSPIREVKAAQLAGLGVVGRHGLLIHPQYGSYVFIGEIVTDLVLPPDKPTVAGCKNCERCLRACPGQALRAEGGVNLAHCRSHISQKKGLLTDWEAEQIKEGGLVWGCDICNDVCPMNRGARTTPILEFLNSAVPLVTPDTLNRIFGDRAFHYRGEKVILRNMNLF